MASGRSHSSLSQASERSKVWGLIITLCHEYDVFCCWIVCFVFSQIYRGVSWWGPRARLFFHDTQTHSSSIRQADFQTGRRDTIQHHPQLAYLHTQPATQRWGLLGNFCQILIIFNFKNHAIMNKRFTYSRHCYTKYGKEVLFYLI